MLTFPLFRRTGPGGNTLFLFIVLMIDPTYGMLPSAKAPSYIHAFCVLSHLTLSVTMMEVKLIF